MYIVQALVSQGISTALGCAFTTLPADQRIVSPQSCGSSLREYPNPCGNLTYRNISKYIRFTLLIVALGSQSVKKKHLIVVKFAEKSAIMRKASSPVFLMKANGNKTWKTVPRHGHINRGIRAE